MKTFKNFALNHPVLFSLVMIALYPVLVFLTYPVNYLFPETEAGLLYSGAMTKLILCAVLLMILWRFGWLSAAGIARFRGIKTWPAIAMILIYHLVINLYAFTGEISTVTSNSPLGLANLVYYLPASLFEEILFRGLILLAMLLAWGETRRGVAKAVLFSSLFFGLIHLFNLAEIPLDVVLLQVLGAGMLGILWAALTLITHSLWPAILLHWLTNAAVNIQLIGTEDFQETTTMFATQAVLLIPLVVFGGYLIWKLTSQAPVEHELTPIWKG